MFLPFVSAASDFQARPIDATERQSSDDSEARLCSLLRYSKSGMEYIGRFKVVGELGRGAMGTVYQAVDPLIGRTIAIKMINLHSFANSGEREFMQDCLIREARSAGSLSHPGIVIIFDVMLEAEAAYIAMERVDGPTLRQWLDATPKPKLVDTIGILRQTASALDYAHAHGIIHRDIKPSNIMLCQGTVKVTDFGIAKITETVHQTQAGLVLGTPSYMSPEQIKAEPVDGMGDQFSLAVIAFEMLTGTRPFQADSLAALVHMIVYQPRPSPRSLNPDLPLVVDAVLIRGLAPVAGDRYASCSEFVTALESVVIGVDQALPQVMERPLAQVAADSGSHSISTASSGPREYAGAETVPSGRALALPLHSGVAVHRRIPPLFVVLAAGTVVLAVLLVIFPRRPTVKTVPKSQTENSAAQPSNSLPQSGTNAPTQPVQDISRKPSTTVSSGKSNSQAPRHREPEDVEARANTGNIVPPQRSAPSTLTPSKPEVHRAPTPSVPVIHQATPRIEMTETAMASNILQRVSGVYPPEARAAGVQGSVRFHALIGTDGRVVNLATLRGDPLLVPAAEEAAKRWRFRPIVRGGRPVEVLTQIQIKFVLPSHD
jgi:TonB family protein